ncbi:MAG: hypothetical protein ACRDF4_09715, partial [Rhabdochlamydiaceae bacterium]
MSSEGGLGSGRSSKTNAPLMSFARFGPGSILIISLLVIFAALLFYANLEYLSIIVVVATTVMIFVKCSETLQLGRPEERNIIGQRCLVINKVTRQERGVVRVYENGGNLNAELWSAETQSEAVT